jgi:hypothetical protein
MQRHSLSDVDNGRRSTLSDEQLDQVVNFAIEQFSAMQPVICTWLFYFIHSEYALDISAETPRRALERDQRIRTFSTNRTVRPITCHCAVVQSEPIKIASNIHRFHYKGT